MGVRAGLVSASVLGVLPVAGGLAILAVVGVLVVLILSLFVAEGRDRPLDPGHG
jgi:hypothetical protein